MMIGKQLVQLFAGHLEGLGEAGTMPGLRGGFAPLPPGDGGAVDTERLGQAFLAQTHHLAAADEAVTPVVHVAAPSA
jgi:hypothetical protein